MNYEIKAVDMANLPSPPYWLWSAIGRVWVYAESERFSGFFALHQITHYCTAPREAKPADLAAGPPHEYVPAPAIEARAYLLSVVKDPTVLVAVRVQAAVALVQFTDAR